MRTLTIINGQSLSDFSVQVYGCIEGVVQLLLDNPFITAFEQVLKPGTKVMVQDTAPVFNQQNVKLAAWFANNNFQVSTGVKPDVLVTDDGNPIITDDNQQILIH